MMIAERISERITRSTSPPHLQADDNILETAEADGLSGVKVVVELAVGHLKEHG